MSVNDVAAKLAAYCRAGENLRAIDELYSPDIESVEACDMPGMDRTQRGIDAVRAKNTWWLDHHEVHGGEVLGPYPHGDRFALLFRFDVTPKATGQRMTMQEVGLYTVAGDRIVKEEFFYPAE